MSEINNVANLATPQNILGVIYDQINVDPSSCVINYTNGTVRVNVTLQSSTPQNSLQLLDSFPSFVGGITRQITVTPSSFDFPAIFQSVIAASGYTITE